METLTDSVIKAFLESSRVYRRSVFQLPAVNRADIQIDQIDGLCPICGPNRPFKNVGKPDRMRQAMMGLALASGCTNFEFKCLTCKKESLFISVFHSVENREITLEKFGEYPRKKIDRDPQLKKFLSEDAENYEKALVSLAQGHGIGAFAYFRRIVETNIYSLLNLLEDELRSTGSDERFLNELKALDVNVPMSTRIDYANKVLPENLKPNGLNPLGAIYGALSEGVHADSDDVCLEKSVSIEVCLKYLISELYTRKRSRESFASNIGKIS